MFNSPALLSCLVFSFFFSHYALAQHNPWLLSPNDRLFTISAVNQSADSAFIGSTAQNLPGNGQLKQITYWLNVQSGLTERINIELSHGYANANFDDTNKERGSTDTTVGLSYQAIDEFLLDQTWLPSVGLHIYQTIAGDYQTQRINAIGDGADGLELSASFGKILRYYGFYGDIGIRDRKDSLPDEYFWNIALFVSIAPNWVATGGYQNTDADSSVDRANPQLALLEEDTQRYSFSVQYQWLNSTFNLGYSRVVDGRNTPESDIYSLSISRRL